MKHKITLHLLPYLLLAFTFIPNSIKSSDNPGLNIGETIPNIEIRYFRTAANEMTSRIYEIKENKHLLIAFMPDITSGNKYSEVMASAFDVYFSKGAAFGSRYEFSGLSKE